MRVDNIRMGFATNSSSLHSIVWHPDFEDDPHDHEYGWGMFKCVTPEAKARYLAQNIYASLYGQMGHEVAKYVVAGLFSGIDFDQPLVESLSGGYVDHQSVMPLPWISASDSAYDMPQNLHGRPGNVALDFIRELSMSLVNNDDIAIVGGNDNEDQYADPIEQDISDRSRAMTFPHNRLGYSERMAIEVRGGNGRWVLFNRISGAKIRIILDGFEYEDADVQLPYPELIDLKITDRCHMDCEFCYQNSCSDGCHADGSNIYSSVACSIGHEGVLEVALGGGDPTIHPDFKKILQAFYCCGAVPSFSTADRRFFDRDDLHEICKMCGGIGFSTHSLSDAIYVSEKMYNARLIHNSTEEAYFPSKNRGWDKLVFHYVMGIQPLSYLEEFILGAGDLREKNAVLLLGYKDVGRASPNPPYNYDGWLDIVDKIRYKGLGTTSIAVDTKLAQDTPSMKERVPSILYHTEEGKHSMYIDLVQNMAGPSSYDVENLRPYEYLKEVFDMFPFVKGDIISPRMRKRGLI